jgi:hypothetical protein
MSRIRTISRNLRTHIMHGCDGDQPVTIPVPYDVMAHRATERENRIRSLVDGLVTDAELARAMYRPPLDVARSRSQLRAYKERIERRLQVPERVRRQFAEARS